MIGLILAGVIVQQRVPLDPAYTRDKDAFCAGVWAAARAVGRAEDADEINASDLYECPRPANMRRAPKTDYLAPYCSSSSCGSAWWGNAIPVPGYDSVTPGCTRYGDTEVCPR